MTSKQLSNKDNKYYVNYIQDLKCMKKNVILRKTQRCFSKVFNYVEIVNVVFYKDILLCSMYRKWQIDKEADKAKKQKSEEERGNEICNKLAKLKNNKKCAVLKEFCTHCSLYTSTSLSSQNVRRQQ